MTEKDNVFIGIDVSKATLDLSLSGNHFKIKNEKDAICQFISQEISLKKIKPTLVCLESTGGYETLAIQCFNKFEIPIHRAHPNKVHSFAKASNHFAKTDKLDAKLLEKYAAFVSNEEKGDKPLSEANCSLQALRNIERNLMETLHADQCRIKNSHEKAIPYLQCHIDFLQKQIEAVRKEIEKIIKSDDDLSKKREILTSYKGVANQTANILLAELPELGTLDNRQIASLIGVAPKTYESGIKKSKGHINGGRFFVRKAVYMAALVASRRNSKMKKFYDRLVASGKAKKVALVAVMRKVIICLNSMLKNNAFYEETDYARVG